jgi:hypothetical protein
LLGGNQFHLDVLQSLAALAVSCPQGDIELHCRWCRLWATEAIKRSRVARSSV